MASDNHGIFNKSFLIGVIATVAIIALIYGIRWFGKAEGVAFDIVAPKETKSGQIETFTIAYNNKTRVTLENAQVIFYLPENVFSPDNPDNNRLEISLGNIQPGQNEAKPIKLVFLGENNTQKTIETLFRYKPSSLTSYFEQKQNINVIIHGSVFDLNINLPNQVLPETNFPIKISWDNQTSLEFPNTQIVVEYPEGFTLTNSSIPAQNNTTFVLGDIGPAQQGVITLEGYISGQGGENKKFRASIGTFDKIKNTFLPIATSDNFLSLVANPLSLKILVNNQNVYVANPGETLEVKLSYQNNYSMAIHNLILKASLNGEMFDFTNLYTNNGYFQYTTKTITWNESQVPQLAVLNPGETGEIAFTIKSKDRYDIKSYKDKNFVLEIKASLESNTLPVGLDVANQIKTENRAEVKLNTIVELITSVYYRDLTANITNCGSFPLKVDTPTCLTVHWQIKNYANNLSNVRISTTLPLGVEYTGKFTGNYGGTAPVYDPLSREFSWNISSVASGSGVISKPYELVFQISVTPTLQQLNSAVDVLGISTLTAIDAFTQAKITATSPGFRSDYLSDKTLTQEMGIVK